MEIEIESKRNNPLLKRTEIYFTVKHEGEGTPNREVIRSELADKLNTKKENIIVNKLDSGFGLSETSGYAKVYSSIKETKKSETDYILKRNKIGVDDKKKAEKKEDAGDAAEKPQPVVEEAKPEEPATVDEDVKEETPVSEDNIPDASKEEETPAPTEEPEGDKPVEEPKVEEKPAETKEEGTQSEKPVKEEETKTEDSKKTEEKKE